jgi:hypothetical protein
MAARHRCAGCRCAKKVNVSHGPDAAATQRPLIVLFDFVAAL